MAVSFDLTRTVTHTPCPIVLLNNVVGSYKAPYKNYCYSTLRERNGARFDMKLGRVVGTFSGNEYMLTWAISGQGHELRVKASYLIIRSCVHIIYHAVYIQSTHTLPQITNV